MKFYKLTYINIDIKNDSLNTFIENLLNVAVFSHNKNLKKSNGSMRMQKQNNEVIHMN